MYTVSVVVCPVFALAADSEQFEAATRDHKFHVCAMPTRTQLAMETAYMRLISHHSGQGRNARHFGQQSLQLASQRAGP